MVSLTPTHPIPSILGPSGEGRSSDACPSLDCLAYLAALTGASGYPVDLLSRII